MVYQLLDVNELETMDLTANPGGMFDGNFVLCPAPLSEDLLKPLFSLQMPIFGGNGLKLSQAGLATG